MSDSLNVRELMQQAQIAAPCSVSWDDMQGDDKTRFCGECKLNVLNAASMSDREVEAALSKSADGGLVCMQIYRRADGTFLTENCPVGLRRVRDRLRRAAAWFAGALSLLVSAGVSAAPSKGNDVSSKKKDVWHSTIKGDCATQSNGVSQDGTGGPAPAVKPIRLAGRVAMPPNDKAVEVGKKALRDAQRSHPLQAEEAQAADSLAYLYERRREYNLALPLRKSALAIYDKLGDFTKAEQSSMAAANDARALKDEAGADELVKQSNDYHARLKK